MENVNYLGDMVEFRMRVYDEPSFSAYEQNIKNNQEKNEDLGISFSEPVEPPPYHISRMLFPRASVRTIVEVFSPEELYRNPETPDFDCTEITLDSGERYTVCHKYEDVKKKLGITSH